MIVTFSFIDDDVLAVFHHSPCIAKCLPEVEIVIGPAETFSESYAQSYQSHPFVGVVVVGVVVVSGVRSESVVIVIEVVVIVVVEIGVYVALF